MIRASVGVKLWRNLFADVDGKRRDITKNGRLSCALFVSSILHHFKLIGDVHSTVEGTLRDMEESGWKKSRSPEPGAVVIWEPGDDHDGTPHPHIGFCISDTTAISNNSKLGYPAKHDLHFGKRHRAVVGYWQKK